jgi:EmrB/QacA subfamily drug resistance transporter
MTPDQIYARRWWTLGVLCLSLLIIGMDNTILNVALPTLARDLHAGTGSLQWIVDSYTLVYASMLLTTGSLGDRFGRKGALSVGLVIFGIGSVAAAFSGSSGLLIACRAVMGVGGCLIMPATLSILTNVFPAEERGRAIGIWAGVSGLGIVAGPTLGGLLLLHFWWGSVFLINAPIVVVALIAGRMLVPDSRDPSAPRLDPVGTGLSIAGLTLLLYAIIEAPSKGLGDPTVLSLGAAGLVVLALFAIWELHTDHPMLDMRFFTNPRFSAASLAIALSFFAMTGLLFFLTQYLQSVLGYSALRAGLGFIPLAVAMMIAAPNSARLDARFGSKLTVGGGLIVAAGAVALVSVAQVHSGFWLIGTALGLLGMGLGFVMAPATNSIMGSLPLAKAGVGSAVNDTTRQVGGALGVAVLGSVLSSVYRSNLHLQGVSAATRAAVRAGVGNAVVAGGHLAPGVATVVDVQAKAAFVHAMHTTALIGVVFVLAGAVVALIWLPAKAAAVPEPTETFETDEVVDNQVVVQPAVPVA